MSFLDTQARNLNVGNVAGYVLDFYKIAANGRPSPTPECSVSSDSYYTKMDLSLPGGFSAGKYIFYVEGLPDDIFARIAPETADAAKVIKLYLYWADVLAASGFLSGITSYLSNFITSPSLPDASKPDALVAELRIINVKRTVGDGRYITQIDAIERVFYQARRTMTPSQARDTAPNYRQAIQALADAAQFDVTIYPSGSASTPLTQTTAAGGAESYSLAAGNRVSKSLSDIAAKLEEANPTKNGRGMLLIRDGALLAGVRPIPYPMGVDPKDLLVSNGILDVQLTGSSVKDPYSAYPDEAGSRPQGGAGGGAGAAGGAAAAGGGAPSQPQPTRDQYEIVLKGRPDLKPGDVVRFDLPQPNEGPSALGLAASLLGPLSGAFGQSETMSNPTFAYVDSVKHIFGRTQGFYTTITGVHMDSAEGDDAWDPRTSTPTETDAASPASTSGDPGTRAAAAINRLANAATQRNGLEVGEVRSFVSNSTQEPTSQTETAWCGLINADGRSNQSRRLAISRDLPLIKEGITYASPFAWGKCGLILPRYPGMRIAVGFRNGSSIDGIDLGAIFETGTTTTEAQAGDYWLCLPAAVPSDQRQQIDSSTVPTAYVDKVSNDLIDADGNRIIEAGEFTVRVSDPSALKSAGARPARPDVAGSITIHHTKTDAKIVIDGDGLITIKGKNISLEATQNINMKADKVEVSVGTEMNVQ